MLALRVLRCLGTGLYSRMSFALTDVENSNKLTIRITFRQRGNWQVRDGRRRDASHGRDSTYVF